MPDTSPASLSPTTIFERQTSPRSPRSDLDARIASLSGVADYANAAPSSALDEAPALAAALDMPTPTRDNQLAPTGERALRTPARDAYLYARAQAGAVGIALADSRMRRALILDRLRHDHKGIASSLPQGYDARRRPAVWRRRERSEWQRHQQTARALEQNAEWQDQLRAELGPNSEQAVRRARALATAREQILARTRELQRDAIDEELARDPEWLTETLGPCPEQGAGRWQTLAGQLAANRLRFLVADDADPGIRPEQAHLTQQVAQFQADAELTQAVGPTPSVGFGM